MAQAPENLWLSVLEGSAAGSSPALEEDALDCHLQGQALRCGYEVISTEQWDVSFLFFIVSINQRFKR